MAEFAKFEVLAFMLILGTLLAVRILRGEISSSSIVCAMEGFRPAGSRVQLLVATIAGAAIYFVSIINSPSDVLPDVPGYLLALIGASNAGYLGVKIYVRRAERNK